LLPVLLLIAGCGQSDPKPPLEVTYIANEGFMIAMGTTKVLIDALPNSKYYVNPSETTVARIMGDVPPFDKIDYLLVTHLHPDHFNAELTSRFLFQHPTVQFIASSEACGKVEGDSIVDPHRSGVDVKMGEHCTFQGDKADVVPIRLKHGGNPNVDNLSFLVRSNGHTIFHVGDARLSENGEYLRKLDWNSYKVDILFIEYFEWDTPAQENIATVIRPSHVILMHIPPGEEENVRKADTKIHPQTVVFSRVDETKRFDGVDDDTSSH
jgi:L-ascorbate metabolism protein UlaG (beta-lactamase superfamily)